MDQLFQIMNQSTSQACQTDFNPPTFSGITELIPQPNGSLLVKWSAAVEVISPPVLYEVYIQPSVHEISELFDFVHLQNITENLQDYLFDTHDAPLAENTSYRVGVRARDSSGNRDSNTAYLEAVSLGVPTGGLVELVRAVKGLQAAVASSVQSNIEDNTIQSKVTVEPCIRS